MSGILTHILGATLFIACFLVITQDMQLFPGALLSALRGRRRRPKSLPRGVESQFIETEDGCRLELWRLPALETPQPYVALIFHGNAGSLENFFLMQLWFQEHNITSYSFDYRGFGHSSGWPNERGLERDSDAVWRYVAEREKLPPSQIIICGFSVGGAPAARIASIHTTKLLVLVSSFSSVLAVLREHPLLRFIARLCWNRLPTDRYVAALSTTSLLLMHGELDSIIRNHHMDDLMQCYRGAGAAEKIIIPGAGHNDVFFAGRHALGEAMKRMLD